MSAGRSAGQIIKKLLFWCMSVGRSAGHIKTSFVGICPREGLPDFNTKKKPNVLLYISAGRSAERFFLICPWEGLPDNKNTSLFVYIRGKFCWTYKQTSFLYTSAEGSARQITIPKHPTIDDV